MFIASAVSANAATFCVNQAGAPCFTTIQAAVNAADLTPETDIINVAPGTYNEIVTIPATEPGLVINGPNSGVSGCTGVRGPEAIVGNTNGAFQILGDNVTVSGFTVQGQTSGAFIGAGVLIGANTTGVQLLNNIIQNNIAGVFLGGDNSVIRGNRIQNNNNPGP
ncbi:MAG TPA: hypothetical protein VNA17_00625, partial [Pyrinomonadaceae bacterium]|nr:hypothetical protein [Pyrinomonadaceae bacterium]